MMLRQTILLSLFYSMMMVTGQFISGPLKRYNVDIGQTSVSGLSSGAYFAVQMQVAFSSIIKGAGIVAGGPYHCGAEHVLLYCMTMPSPFGSSTGVVQTKQSSGKTIDDISNMKHQRVYIISGSLDTTVSRGVVAQLYDYYVTNGGFIDKTNVILNQNMKISHTFPTDFNSDGNNECTASKSPYISNCGFDSTGTILQHIYPDIANRTMTTNGQWLRFNQTEFVSSGKTHQIGLDDYGYVYVPQSCTSGTVQCRLHIAFHGCSQSYSQIGDKFIKHTGYDKWADHNKLIILFPQTRSDLNLHLTIMNGWLNNYKACWDWVGFYGTNFAEKHGAQMSVIRKMITRITGN